MKKKVKLRRIARRKNHRIPTPGTAPGHFSFETGENPRLLFFSYNETEFKRKEAKSLVEVHKHITTETNSKHWLQIIGYGNTAFFNELKEVFEIHPLELEDVLSGHARPKVEVHQGKVFDISRLLSYSEDLSLNDEQFSLFYQDNWLISLQEKESTCFEPLHERMARPGTLLRSSPSFYLYYAITDAIIDNYFPLTESIENRLIQIEEELFDKPTRVHLSEIQLIRRDLLSMRKTITAEKENLAELIRNMDADAQLRFGLYMQDAFEHCVYIQELIDSQKEIAFSLIDVYLSSQNNRMSEVMKVLTIITTIFIPLSFIAGIYGMNFSRQNPEGEQLPLNMPELYWPNGYLFVLGLMVLIVIGQLIFFRRKGWI